MHSRAQTPKNVSKVDFGGLPFRLQRSEKSQICERRLFLSLLKRTSHVGSFMTPPGLVDARHPSQEVIFRFFVDVLARKARIAICLVKVSWHSRFWSPEPLLFQSFPARCPRKAHVSAGKKVHFSAGKRVFLLEENARLCRATPFLSACCSEGLRMVIGSFAFGLMLGFVVPTCILLKNFHIWPPNLGKEQFESRLTSNEH